MAKRWTGEEENKYKAELLELYVRKNLTIAEVGKFLRISYKTVFQRLGRLGIKSQPQLKSNYLRKRQDILIPKDYSADLAEFFGIMLGDGKLSHFQVMVTLGSKEASYAEYVSKLIEKIFGVKPKISIRPLGYRVIYLGSVDLTKWLQDEGLVFNKVKSQVSVPKWIFRKKEFMERFVRGFFDTDGSVYRLKFGIQISFTNYSLPLLQALRKMLVRLEYKPSLLSAHKVYITRAEEVRRFFEEIGPKNTRHLNRFQSFTLLRERKRI